MIKTDVLIIGAGAVGVGIARELSKFELDVLVVEKKDDVGGDATKSCSAMISTEFSVPPLCPRVKTTKRQIENTKHHMFFAPRKI